MGLSSDFIRLSQVDINFGMEAVFIIFLLVLLSDSKEVTVIVVDFCEYIYRFFGRYKLFSIYIKAPDLVKKGPYALDHVF